jgi:hypothetical protein
MASGMPELSGREARRSITECNRFRGIARFIGSKPARLPAPIAPTVIELGPRRRQARADQADMSARPKPFSDFAIVLRPPVRTTQSARRPSVNFRAFSAL